MLGTPVSTSAMNRTGAPSQVLAEYSDKVDAGQHAQRNADGAGQGDEDQRAHQRVGHAAGGAFHAGRNRQLR